VQYIHVKKIPQEYRIPNVCSSHGDILRGEELAVFFHGFNGEQTWFLIRDPTVDVAIYSLAGSEIRKGEGATLGVLC